MQSSFLIFIPTLNYCISLSMNERKRYAMKPPPWKKNRLCTSMFRVSLLKEMLKNEVQIFHIFGVSVHFQHIFDNEMNTDSWVMKYVLQKWSKIF